MKSKGLWIGVLVTVLAVLIGLLVFFILHKRPADELQTSTSFEIPDTLCLRLQEECGINVTDAVLISKYLLTYYPEDSYVNNDRKTLDNEPACDRYYMFGIADDTILVTITNDVVSHEVLGDIMKPAVPPVEIPIVEEPDFDSSQFQLSGIVDYTTLADPTSIWYAPRMWCSNEELLCALGNAMSPYFPDIQTVDFDVAIDTIVYGVDSSVYLRVNDKYDVVFAVLGNTWYARFSDNVFEDGIL